MIFDNLITMCPALAHTCQVSGIVWNIDYRYVANNEPGIIFILKLGVSF